MNDEKFAKEYKALVERVITLCEKAMREGLLSVEELIDRNKFYQRDVLELGLQLVINGMLPEIIDTILTNIVELEQDKNKKLLKNIKKGVVLGFESGHHPATMMLLLNSYVNIGIEDAMKRYEELYVKQYKEKE